MRQNIIINSWNELQDTLFSDAWDPQIERFRSRFAFRGLSDTNYQLETTLMRLGGPYSDLERHLLRNFRKYAHRNVVERDSIWHWLSVAQHHGLPTRLMDWTYSPFVAMHFATANIEKFDTDGAIWAINYLKVHEQLPDQLHKALEVEGANVFTVDMLSQLFPDLTHFHHVSEQEAIIFFEPSSIDDNIVNQHALFSVASDPTALLNQWLEHHPDIWFKVTIPADLKWEIRDKLDQANVTERVLFPGMDGLSRWLTRHYSPKR